MQSLQLFIVAHLCFILLILRCDGEKYLSSWGINNISDSLNFILTDVNTRKPFHKIFQNHQISHYIFLKNNHVALNVESKV